MESCKDWYRGGDPKKHVPKWMVGLFGGLVSISRNFVPADKFTEVFFR
jgi:solute carrier family 25 citrate transporter 1